MLMYLMLQKGVKNECSPSESRGNFVSFVLIFYIFTSVYLDCSCLLPDHHPVHPPHKSLVHIHVFFSNYNNYFKIFFSKQKEKLNNSYKLLISRKQ